MVGIAAAYRTSQVAKSTICTKIKVFLSDCWQTDLSNRSSLRNDTRWKLATTYLGVDFDQVAPSVVRGE